MPDRLWMFNPGCSDQPCCGETEPPPTTCCTTCDTSNADKSDIEMTDANGTHTMVWSATKNAWWCCYSFTHPNTYLTGGPGICAETGSGQTVVEMRYNGCSLTQLGVERSCGSVMHLSRTATCGTSGIVAETNGDIYSSSETYDDKTSTQVNFTIPTNMASFGGIYPVTGSITIERPSGVVFTAPKKLYLSDGLGTVPITYKGFTPTSSGSTTWWGCALRSVANGREPGAPDGSGECKPSSISFDHSVVFGLTCSSNNGYVLRLYWRGCSYRDNGIDLVRHITEMPHYTCAGGWNNGHDIFNVMAAVPQLPSDCDPFTLEFSQDLSTLVYPDHAMREIYGSGTQVWTITE